MVICADPGGDYEYIGVRSSDNATLQVDAESTDDGFVARTDGATYTVSPSQLVVVSGGKIIYRDTWIDYGHPRFSAEHGDATSARRHDLPRRPTSRRGSDYGEGAAAMGRSVAVVPVAG